MDMAELLEHFESLLNKPKPQSTSPEQQHRIEEVHNLVSTQNSVIGPILKEKYSEPAVLN